MFDEALRKAELFALKSLKSVVINLWGNHYCVEYQMQTEELQKRFCQPEA